MLLELANVGYQVGAAGIVAFTVAFLVIIRWWTDHLGRVLAGVLSATSAVLIMTTIRMMSPEIALDHTYQSFRVAVFWVFGVGVWLALGSFVWAQFFAPRIRHRERMTTRREFKHEEAALADSRHDRDVRLHNHSGGDD